MKVTSQQNKTARLHHLQRELKQAGLDACLIENPIDLFYFTGLPLSTGKLLVDTEQALLLVDGRYAQVAKEQAPCPSALYTPEEWLSFCKKHRAIGFDGSYTSYDQFLQLEQLQKKEGGLIPAKALFKSLRSIKDEGEIAQLRKNAALLWKGFEFLSHSLKVGVTEKELSRRFQIFCLENGGDGPSFEPIIAFGSHSAMPHYRSQDVPLKEGDIVLIDIGAACNAYHSDMTRVLFFKQPDPYLNKLYEINKKAQRSALALCRPGSTLKELDLAARAVFKEENVEDLFVHNLGHGIGLQVHEFPRIRFDNEDKDVVLKKGMAITIEPGLYVPGVGGVRYEDTIVITDDGHENFYPKDT